MNKLTRTQWKKRRQQPKPGDVFAVPLGDGTCGFGQVCWGVRDCAFFDLRSDAFPKVEDIVLRPVIFRVTVEQSILRSGKWLIVGNQPLTGSLAEPASYRNQPVGSNQLYLYRAGQLHKAKLEDVKDLELLAIWFDQHIVTRLRNYFSGRLDPMTERFKRIKVYGPDGQELKFE